MGTLVRKCWGLHNSLEAFFPDKAKNIIERLFFFNSRIKFIVGSLLQLDMDDVIILLQLSLCSNTSGLTQQRK